MTTILMTTNWTMRHEFRRGRHRWSALHAFSSLVARFFTVTTVYCQHCGYRYDAIARDFPMVCPNLICEKPAFWSTQPRWEITENDRRFLRSIKVTGVEPD